MNKKIYTQIWLGIKLRTFSICVQCFTLRPSHLNSITTICVHLKQSILKKIQKRQFRNYFQIYTPAKAIERGQRNIIILKFSELCKTLGRISIMWFYSKIHQNRNMVKLLRLLYTTLHQLKLLLASNCCCNKRSHTYLHNLTILKYKSMIQYTLKNHHLKPLVHV